MRADEMNALKKEYGNDMEITPSYHLHDEDEWNKWTITYRGIIVGSELVSVDFVKDYIEEVWGVSKDDRKRVV